MIGRNSLDYQVMSNLQPYMLQFSVLPFHPIGCDHTGSSSGSGGGSEGCMEPPFKNKLVMKKVNLSGAARLETQGRKACL